MHQASVAGDDQCDRREIGCTGQTLDEWVKKADLVNGTEHDPPTEMTVWWKALERCHKTDDRG